MGSRGLLLTSLIQSSLSGIYPVEAMPDFLPWTLLHARLHRLIRQRQLLQQGESCLVAVSGGQDSLCLIRLLLDLQPKWGWKLAIAHCNHRWRPDAEANALYVRDLAAQWQVPYHQATATVDVATEAAAREWRYGVLGAIAQQKGYTSVVTGHTGSDRAETLLYNLIRGSGADGLQALTWQRDLGPNVQLVRPLLEVVRSETLNFCQERGLKIWQDSTNDDLHHARNRIRQALLPYLKTHFNPQVEQSLAHTAELLRAEVDFLEKTADSLRRQASPVGTSEAPRLSRHVLKGAPLALQRRVMRQFLLQVLPQTPSFEQIEKLVALLHAPNRSQTDSLPGGAIATVENDWIKIVYDA